jgi:hypothetical protein
MLPEKVNVTQNYTWFDANLKPETRRIGAVSIITNCDIP